MFPLTMPTANSGLLNLSDILSLRSHSGTRFFGDINNLTATNDLTLILTSGINLISNKIGFKTTHNELPFQ